MSKKPVKFSFDSQDQSLKPVISEGSNVHGLVSNRRQLLALILKNVLDKIGTDTKKIALAQVLISLKLDGVLKDPLTPEQYKMVKVITNGILEDPDQRRQAEEFIKKLR
jgi:hypothetical protein